MERKYLQKLVAGAILAGASLAFLQNTDSFSGSNKMPRFYNKRKTVFTGWEKGYDVYTIGSEKGSLKNITNTPDIDEERAYWSKDGRILFSVGSRYFTIKDDGTNQREISRKTFDNRILYSRW